MNDVYNKRVLIVDDLEDMRSVLACLVESAGAPSPRTAASATEALEKILQSQDEGNPFQLILLDIKMPGINGMEAAKSFRAAGYKGFIAACTAVVSGLGRSEAREAGIDVYFDKRVVKKDTIKALLQQAR